MSLKEIWQNSRLLYCLRTVENQWELVFQFINKSSQAIKQTTNRFENQSSGFKQTTTQECSTCWMLIHIQRKSFRRKIKMISTNLNFEGKHESQCPYYKMIWGLMHLSQDLMRITEKLNDSARQTTKLNFARNAWESITLLYKMIRGLIHPSQDLMCYVYNWKVTELKISTSISSSDL